MQAQGNYSAGQKSCTMDVPPKNRIMGSTVRLSRVKCSPSPWACRAGSSEANANFRHRSSPLGTSGPHRRSPRVLPLPPSLSAGTQIKGFQDVYFLMSKCHGLTTLSSPRTLLHTPRQLLGAASTLETIRLWSMLIPHVLPRELLRKRRSLDLAPMLCFTYYFMNST